MQEKIDAIFTDFGGVLLDLQFNRCFNKFRELGVNTPEKILFYDDVFNNLMQKLEIGKIDTYQFYAELRKLVNINLSDREINEAWNLIIGEVPIYKLKLLRELRKHYRVYMVSNTNAPHFDFTRKNLFRDEGLCVDDYFDKLYLSHEIHAQKPDEAFYRIVLEDSKEIAERSLFVDDLSKNIEGAQKAGFKTLQIDPTDDLYKKFDKLLV